MNVCTLKEEMGNPGLQTPSSVFFLPHITIPVAMCLMNIVEALYPMMTKAMNQDGKCLWHNLLHTKQKVICIV